MNQPVINIFILLAAFIGMEGVAWFSHKYIMHGILWRLHRDHHQKQDESVFEKNDFFFLFYSLPGIICLYMGVKNNFNFYFWTGAGITLYGMAYFVIHDVFIHRRIKFFRNSHVAYFMALRKAHKIHHKSHLKQNGKCFGMLWVPLKYFRETIRNRP